MLPLEPKPCCLRVTPIIVHGTLPTRIVLPIASSPPPNSVDFRVLVDDDFLRQVALGARVEEATGLELDALDCEVVGADAVHLRARFDRP